MYPKMRISAIPNQAFVILALIGSLQMTMSESDNGVSKVWKDLRQDDAKMLRPEYLGPPTNVSVSITVLRIGRIDEIAKTFVVDMFFRQKWNDYRLEHNLSQVLTPAMGRDHPSNFIWIPDTVFFNGVRGDKHVITTANHKLDIYQNGTVNWSSRITLEASCEFDLRMYPMDTQICNIGVQSYAYDTNKMNYNWEPENCFQMSSYELPLYSLTVVNNTKDVRDYEGIGSSYLLRVYIMFERRKGVYIIQAFVPCITLVMVAWLAQWLHPNCVSARMGLGIITILTLVKRWWIVTHRLPETTYMTALDFYLIANFFFIVLSILEYTLVANSKFARWKRTKTRSLKEARIEQRMIMRLLFPKSILETNQLRKTGSNVFKYFKDSQKPSGKVTKFGPQLLLDNQGRCVYRYISKREKNETLKKDYISMWKPNAREKRPYYYKPYVVTGKPSSIDVICRLLFPFAFSCFNIIFWVTYLRT